MLYRDIDLKLSGSPAGYFVEVLESSSGRSEPAPLKLPAQLADEQRLVAYRRLGGQAALELGRALFEALFPPEIRGFWEKGEGAADADQPLRLRLDIRAPELAALPWELVHDGGHHLAISRRRPVVRYLYGRGAVRPVVSSEPLNVLVVAATPRDATFLPAVEQELRLVGNSLKGLQAGGKVGRVDTLPRATLPRLQEQLRRGYQVLHFIGHGTFAEGKGYLIFEDDDGAAKLVNAETLSYFLRDTPTRLLFLNACQTALNLTKASPLGVAHAAHAAGIPAVVAMQDTVVDSVAAVFAFAFYQALAEGCPLESCMAEGKKAVVGVVGLDRADWAIPVLFSNAQEGLLWKPPDDADHPRPEPSGGKREASGGTSVNMERARVNGSTIIVQGDGGVVNR
jgi:hypothetical protein